MKDYINRYGIWVGLIVLAFYDWQLAIMSFLLIIFLGVMFVLFGIRE